MRVKDLILKLRAEKDKLSERRVISFDIIHMIKFSMKGRNISNNFNGKCFIRNKIGHLAKDCINKVQ